MRTFGGWPGGLGWTAFGVVILSGACGAGEIDGDGDADADGDADTDADSDADGDADEDSGTGCQPALGGSCNPVVQCGCASGQYCALTVAGDAIEEGCATGPAGAGQHGEPCPDRTCAAGHICLRDGSEGSVCLRLCTEHDHCPTRSLCDVSFTMSTLDPAPYRACSPQRAEAETTYGVCVAPAGDCPGAGTAVREIGAPDGTWSCSLEVGDEEVTLAFEITAGGHGIRGSALRFPNLPGRLVPVTCGELEIDESGETFTPTGCSSSAMPSPGQCAVLVELSNGQVTGNFRCVEIPGTGSDLLTTMDGGERGAGSFALRQCDVSGG